MTLLATLRQKVGARRLSRMVHANKRSPATLEFIRRRNAALRHTPKRVLEA